MSSVAPAPFALLASFFFFFFWSSLASSSSSKVCHSGDRQALLDFLAGVEDVPQDMSTSWKTQDCCSWFAVQCNNKTGRVTQLLIFDAFDSSDGFIGYSSLRGPLSASLGQLSALEVLAVSRQGSISGTIPASLGMIPTLREVYLDGNSLTGTIPSSFGSLKRLRVLQLNDNKLSGAIPSGLGSLQGLQQLSLQSNQFSGSIPASFGKLRSLEKLDLSQNKLAGSIPSSLGLLKKLDTLYLYKNKIAGPLPASLGGLASLQVMDVSDNLLSGPLPSSLADSHSVTSLELRNNRLSGTIPASWGSFVNLTILDLSWNRLGGNLPSSFTKLARLDALKLAHNSMEGSVPDMSNTSLSNLDLSFNRYRLGAVPGWISSLGAYGIELQLASCGITSFPSFLPSMSLSQLDLSSNSITGEIPFLSGSASVWLSINLSYNPLRSSLASHFSKYERLTTLDLRSTRLFGSVDPVFSSNLAWLDHVDLSDNQLTGRIPSPEPRLAIDSWKYLNLSGNLLQGLIPEGMSNLGQMTVLDLSRNRLLGSIPRAFGEMASGERDSKLQTLLLDNNRLQGSVPESLANLTTLNLAFNNLSGEIPTMVGHKFPRSSFQHNPRLCGFPLQAC